MNCTDLPRLLTDVPGPGSQAWVDRLARRECPAITARRARRAAVLGAAADDPIVWDAALGANVLDVDGNRFVDFTAGFGVAAVGHANPRVVEAARSQAGRLLHAMGDAFPDPRRIELLERLCALTGLDRVMLGSSGSDAVEAAVKTARMATGRDGIVAFSGGYHGLSLGALAETGYAWRAMREPFAGQLGPHVRHAPFGGALPDLSQVGAVLVEPIQGRGGVRVPPDGWLHSLVQAAHDAGALVIFDEIYTGFGRTGTWFRYQSAGLGGTALRPDLLCVGKAMAGGYPISACVGTAAAMDAWGASTGAAIHTQTFLGNPVGSAMALAAIDEVERLIPEVVEKGALLVANLTARGLPVRGAGLLLGVEVPDPLRVSRELLRRGYIALPAGEMRPLLADAGPVGEVLAIIPPYTVSLGQIDGFLRALDEVLA